MTITYTAPAISEITAENTTVEVTYTDTTTGFEHKRSVNVPRLEDGSVDNEYYQEILEGQLRGVENKIKVGVITFTEPVSEEAPTE